MKARVAAAVALFALAACSPAIPDDTLRCDDTHGCPSGWSCVGGRCSRSGPPRDAGPRFDAEGSGDAGPAVDVGPGVDAGPAVDGGPGEDAGTCAGGCFWGCRDESCDRPVGLAAGEVHTCALMQSGRVSCWGGNASGQLGLGDNSDRARPAAVVGIATATQLAAGGLTTCAIEGGALFCWGNNSAGQLGNGGMMNLHAPSMVRTPPTDVRAVALGVRHACAITGDGAVWCWGQNDAAQTNPAMVSGAVNSPLDTMVRGATALALGYEHSCAVVSTEVVCWGANDWGQLGRPGADRSAMPATAVERADELVSGQYFACARDAGAVRCFGENTMGQLGSTATLMPGMAAAVELSASAIGLGAGRAHACAILDDGSVLCWGDNTAGAVGNGSIGGSAPPGVVAGLPGAAVQVAAGNGHTCALLAGGRIYCWGRDMEGQLGDGTPDAPRATPEPVLPPP